jgi:hypothetical protein
MMSAPTHAAGRQPRPLNDKLIEHQFGRRQSLSQGVCASVFASCFGFDRAMPQSRDLGVPGADLKIDLAEHAAKLVSAHRWKAVEG